MGRFAAVVDAVEEMVQRIVNTAVEQRITQAPSVPGGKPFDGDKAAMDLAGDEMARTLMQKMRDLAQEDRFRSGRLR